MFYRLKAAAAASARGCALLSLLLALAVTGSGDAVAKPLSGAEIQLLLAGNSAHDDDGAKQSFHKHGATFYQLPGRPADRGNWWVSGDKYCSRWGGAAPPATAWSGCRLRAASAFSGTAATEPASSRAMPCNNWVKPVLNRAMSL